MILSGFGVAVVVVRLIKKDNPQSILRGLLLIVGRFFHVFENFIEFFFVQGLGYFGVVFHDIILLGLLLAEVVCTMVLVWFRV